MKCEIETYHRVENGLWRCHTHKSSGYLAVLPNLKLEPPPDRCPVGETEETFNSLAAELRAELASLKTQIESLKVESPKP